MSESAFKRAEGQEVPDEFLCPISQVIMSDPVFNQEGTTFDRKAIEKWIEKNGTCPFSRKPLSKKDLKPNRALRESIYKFVQTLSEKQKKAIQYLNVYQVARLREKQIEEMGYITPSVEKDSSKLKSQLEILKNKIDILQKQLQIQKQMKQFAQEQCELQTKKAIADRKKLKVSEQQKKQLSQINQMLLQKINKHENQIDALIIQKDTAIKQYHKMRQNNQMLIQKNARNEQQNEILRKENLELKSIQKIYCEQIEALQKNIKYYQYENEKLKKLVPSKEQISKVLISKMVKLTPDTISPAWQKGWILDSKNRNICIVQKICPYWLCSSPLPTNGDFFFTIKAIKVTDSQIKIGVIEIDQKGEQMDSTYKNCVFLNTYDKKIYKPNEKQTEGLEIKFLGSKLPKCPFQIECHLNRQQSTIAWHYAGKQQAKSNMPTIWKTERKPICAIVDLWREGDSLEFM